jgi:hypothetical protein
VELDKNQVYIGVGENIGLNLSASDNYEEVLGVPFSKTDFNWSSSNEEIALVDSEGNVQGLTDRIYKHICKT